MFLTFDDGPDPETTPRVLDALKRHQARATFFVIGCEAEKYPDLVQRMASEGHSIGEHTHYHHHPSQVTSEDLGKELSLSSQSLQAILGTASNLFRPPFGKLTPGKMFRLWREGRKIVLWNRDPKDFLRESAEELRAWFQANPLYGGDIVLLHDTSAITTEVLESVLVAGHARGLKFLPLH